MHIIVAGATGLIGRALISALSPMHHITVITRNKASAQRLLPETTLMSWQEATSQATDWFKQFDLAINLSGENIGKKRWSTTVKHNLVASRVDTTNTFVKWCLACGEQSPRLLNASAIGYYGLTLPGEVTAPADESTVAAASPRHFLETICQAWEGALKPVIAAGVPTTILRFGVVLAKHDGALAKLLPAFKMGLGGKIGDGRQPFVWVSLRDVVQGICWVIAHPEVVGPVNLVAPQQINQATFANALAKRLHRPACVPMPAWFIKAVFGQMGEELLLGGKSVLPKRLLEAGFEFQDKTIAQALENLL